MKRSRSWLLSILLMLVSGAVCGIELDLTFGYAGKSVTPGGAGQSWLYAMAVAPDGSIVVAGQIDYHAVIKRFDRRGQPDLTFGIGGVVTGSFGSFQDLALAVAVQPDGRTVIAGVANGPGPRLLVARYLVNGDPDPSFAGAGFVAIDPLGGGAGATSVALDASGRIVVAGSANPQVPPSSPPVSGGFAVVRFLANGVLDGSFGTGGLSSIDMLHPATVTGMVLLPDGRMVVGGSAFGPGGYFHFALARLLSDGALDPSFGVGGRVSTEIGLSSDCYGLARDPHGRIVAVGEAYTGTSSVNAVARYLEDGALDPAFGTGGVATPDLGNALVRDVAVDAGGRVLLAGAPDFVLARLLPNGQPDSLIGPHGWTIAGMGSQYPIVAQPEAIAVAPDGGILIAGIVDIQAGGSIVEFGLVRYAPNATPIPALSSAGWVLLASLLGLSGLLAIRRSA